MVLNNSFDYFLLLFVTFFMNLSVIACMSNVNVATRFWQLICVYDIPLLSVGTFWSFLYRSCIYKNLRGVLPRAVTWKHSSLNVVGHHSPSIVFLKSPSLERCPFSSVFQISTLPWAIFWNLRQFPKIFLMEWFWWLFHFWLSKNEGYFWLFQENKFKDLSINQWYFYHLRWDRGLWTCSHSRY